MKLSTQYFRMIGSRGEMRKALRAMATGHYATIRDEHEFNKAVLLALEVAARPVNAAAHAACGR